jgi:hypothetical protein
VFSFPSSRQYLGIEIIGVGIYPSQITTWGIAEHATFVLLLSQLDTHFIFLEQKLFNVPENNDERAFPQTKK